MTTIILCSNATIQKARHVGKGYHSSQWSFPWPSACTICCLSCQATNVQKHARWGRSQMPCQLEETDNFNHKAIFRRPPARVCMQRTSKEQDT